MKITDILKSEYIVERLTASDRQGALAELTGVFTKAGIGAGSDAMISVLLERERLGSTGIGDGIAIPHGKLAGLEEMVVSFGRSREGVSFDAMDGKPVHLFFLLMAPENSAGQHLKILAKISRMLKDVNFRKGLMEADSQSELFRIISEKDDET